MPSSRFETAFQYLPLAENALHQTNLDLVLGEPPIPLTKQVLMAQDSKPQQHHLINFFAGWSLLKLIIREVKFATMLFSSSFTAEATTSEASRAD